MAHTRINLGAVAGLAVIAASSAVTITALCFHPAAFVMFCAVSGGFLWATEKGVV